MKISKRKLMQIIKEEYDAIAAEMPSAEPAAASLEPAAAELPPAQVAESEEPEGQLVVEMDNAIAGLQTVMESLESAASICDNCVQEVAAQGPVLQAVSSQVSALQETLEAVEQIVNESTDVAAPAAAMSGDDIPAAATEVQMEALRRKLIRRLR